MAVALMAKPMMKREKVFCLLKAIRLAMNTETFNRHIFWYLTKVFYLNVTTKYKMIKIQQLNSSFPILKKRFRVSLFIIVSGIIGLLFITPCFSQVPDAVIQPFINSVRFHMYGNQLTLPVYTINGGDQLELNFDDMEGDIKSYYYSFQLCDYDWQPVDISPFIYIKGFTQQRITTYR